MKVSLHSRLWLVILAAVFIYHDGIWHAEPVGSGEPEQICYMEHEDTPQIFRIPAPHHHQASNEHGECTQHNHHNWLLPQFYCISIHNSLRSFQNIKSSLTNRKKRTIQLRFFRFTTIPRLKSQPSGDLPNIALKYTFPDRT
ncbi:hypothetical protein CLV93_106105 [Prolixibacter denitrificans]|uniref:Uncharacterized protein n=1 Tax=Prolixibacter denitrificans TaxID=1541063 RepID=A0A2P8CBL7_9BACT|nr:hypothetical protein CLV93_106105 [Prolixibacter denitrificans]